MPPLPRKDKRRFGGAFLFGQGGAKVSTLQQHSHEAIIPPAEFEQVQAELVRRKQIGRSFSGNSVFASRIVCGDCGGYYGHKIWHSNNPYRKIIWRCNQKYITVK